MGYRSAVFYASDEERDTANALIKELNDSGSFSSPIVTEVTAGIGADPSFLTTRPRSTTRTTTSATRDRATAARSSPPSWPSSASSSDRLLDCVHPRCPRQLRLPT